MIPEDRSSISTFEVSMPQRVSHLCCCHEHIHESGALILRDLSQFKNFVGCFWESLRKHHIRRIMLLLCTCLHIKQASCFDMYTQQTKQQGRADFFHFDVFIHKLTLFDAQNNKSNNLIPSTCAQNNLINIKQNFREKIKNSLSFYHGKKSCFTLCRNETLSCSDGDTKN